jgi:hypothetical protein
VTLAAARAWFAPGRWPRGVAAWLAAALLAAPLGATLTVAFLLARESAAYAPFTVHDWWIFVNLWRPLVVAGLVLAPIFSAPLAAAAVFAIRRGGWPRPLADIVAGVLCALGSLALVLLVARSLGPMGEGP